LGESIKNKHSAVGLIKQPTAEEWERRFQNKYLKPKEKTA
jgi:hypothetical protein